MGDTRRAMMQKLLEHKPAGLTVGELSSELGITRTAVQQHIVGLERDGLVASVQTRSTGGRPSRAYGLTERGYEEFPRKYALLAQGLLATTADTLGEGVVESLLAALADRIAREAGHLNGEPGSKERVAAVIELMNELGYDAAPLDEGSGVSASNCIYHEVARQTRAVCRFDVRLLSRLLGQAVDHSGCMLDGETSCAFRISQEGV